MCVFGVEGGLLFSCKHTFPMKHPNTGIIRTETVHGSQDWEVAGQRWLDGAGGGEVPSKALEEGRVWPSGICALIPAGPGGRRTENREGRRRDEPVEVTAVFPSTDLCAYNRPGPVDRSDLGQRERTLRGHRKAVSGTTFQERRPKILRGAGLKTSPNLHLPGTETEAQRW